MDNFPLVAASKRSFVRCVDHVPVYCVPREHSSLYPIILAFAIHLQEAKDLTDCICTTEHSKSFTREVVSEGSKITES